MYKFIEKPNLPENDVDTAAISASAGEAIKKLNALSIKTIQIKPCENLPDGLNEHADLQLLHMGKNKFLTPSGCEHLYDKLVEKEFTIKTVNKLGKEYPLDVPLNAKIVGRFIICNTRTISKTVLMEAEIMNLTVIDTKQGYSGCSVCVLNENAIITDDKNIFTAAQIFLNDVTLVEKNSIRLKNYNYGFIGGCCGKISKNKIAFNGSLMSHSDCNKIADALNRNNITGYELHSGVLEDIGGIIPLTEKTV